MTREQAENRLSNLAVRHGFRGKHELIYRITNNELIGTVLETQVRDILSSLGISPDYVYTDSRFKK